MFAANKNRQRGDTIVEVLIAMTVASSVLGITYATMNRNLSQTRDAQERSEASKLAQGQIEALKARLDASLAVPAGAFCITGVTTPVVLPGSPSANFQTDDFANYINCRNTFYNYAIQRDSIDTRLYRFYVRWERVDGNGRNQITMVYRI